jgi:hypothetical protein
MPALFEIHDRNASGLESGQSSVAKGGGKTYDVKDIGSASKRSPVKATNICRDIPSSPSLAMRKTCRQWPEKWEQNDLQCTSSESQEARAEARR